MKREEAIKMLNQLVNMLSDDFGDSELCEDALQMAITALQNQPVWIPVSERLPEDGDARFYMCIVENHAYVLPVRGRLWLWLLYRPLRWRYFRVC